MTIPTRSKKRLKAIEDGTYKPKPRKPMKRTVFKAKEGAKLLNRAFGKAPKGARSKAMKEADKYFSQWIRLRDADAEGYVRCVTSGKRMFWKDADCGHWISRAKLATRYDERNCHAQGKMSNRFQGGHFLEHGIAIERIHGKGTKAELEAKALRPCKMTTADFQFIAKTYKARVAWIMEHEPSKFNRP